MLMATQELQQMIADYFKTQPVLKAWLFGSYSRGEQREDSVVNILIQVYTRFPIYFSSMSNSKEIVSLNSSMACGREGHVKREMIATKFICPSILPSAV